MTSSHDALFRYTFAQPEHAVGLLRSVLPAVVVAGIDWRTLQPLPGTQVDEHLRRQQSDLAFSVQRDGCDTLVYVLVEHKRKPDRWAIFQLLGYVMGLWRDLRRASNGRRLLPRVVPVLLVQSGAQYVPTSLAEILEAYDLEAEGPVAIGSLELDMHQPQFDPFVACLDEWSEEHRRSLAITLLAKVTIEALVSLPAADAALLRHVFGGWRDTLRRLLGTRTGPDALRALWSYTIAVVDMPVQTLIEIAEETMDPLVQRKFKPPSEQLRDQGIAKGLAQGEVVGRRDLLQRQLTKRFGELPDHAMQWLHAASREQLDALGDRLLDAASLAEALDT